MLRLERWGIEPTTYPAEAHCRAQPAGEGVGDHLGHRAPKVTAAYAKVDITGLREAANFTLGDLI